MILLYGLARDVPTVSRPGVEDAEVRVVRVAGWWAVLSEHGHAPGRDREAALAHAAVSTEVALETAFLPVRLRAAHQDRASLASELEREQQRLAAAFDACAHGLEWLLRLPASSAPSPRPDETASGGPGTTYLLQRAAQERSSAVARDHDLARIAAAARPLQRLAEASRDATTARGVERCLLVPRARLAEARAAAEIAQRELPTLTLGGPWAPWSFADTEPAP